MTYPRRTTGTLMR